MKIAFQMEAMDEAQKDDSATLVLMQEACARGHEVYHYHPNDLSMSDEAIRAQAARVDVDLETDPHYTLEHYHSLDMTSMDIVMFRQDPPFDMRYFTNTLVLESLSKLGVFVVNDPYWIRNMPDKHAIFDFAELLPPTLISENMFEIEAFFETHKDIIVKPLYGFHGHGVERIDDVSRAKDLLEQYQEPLMFQPFLPEAYEGNKRFLFFAGEFVGAIQSVPHQQDGDFRPYRETDEVAYELNTLEQEACEKIGRVLKERNILFVGVDFIGSYLIEINTGGVGGLQRFNAIYGGKWEAKLWDIIERQAKN